MRRNAASVLIQRREHLVAVDDLRAAELLPQACLRSLANAGSADEHHATLPRHLHPEAWTNTVRARPAICEYSAAVAAP